MSALRKKLAEHRVATFCAITFALTWGLWFAVVYPQAIPILETEGNPLSSTSVVVFVAAGMLVPSIGVLLTRLVTCEGFKNAWIRPRRFKQTWKYYVIGWFGPVVLVAASAALYFALNPRQFDPSMSGYIEAMSAQIAQSDMATIGTPETIREMGIASLALVFVAPLLNFVACFGEEWGWRGYLLPHLMERHSAIASVAISGIIWGLWHAPITALGHNYGLDYPGWPFLGIFAMCCFCVVAGSFLSWMTIRAKSCLPAVLAHGAINGCGTAPLVFMATAANPFIGPAPTGIIGGMGFIVVAILCAVSLKRNGKRTF